MSSKGTALHVSLKRGAVHRAVSRRQYRLRLAAVAAAFSSFYRDLPSTSQVEPLPIRGSIDLGNEMGGCSLNFAAFYIERAAAKGENA